MENNYLARPYAKAIFANAKLNNLFMEWEGFLKHSSELLSMTDVKELLKNPNLTHQQVLQILIDACGNVSFQESVNLLYVLSDNNRLYFLPEIYELFMHYKSLEDNIMDINVIIAFSPDDAFKSYINEFLEKKLQKKTIISYIVKPEILGGIIIKYDDYVIDGSIIKSIEDIRNTLLL